MPTQELYTTADVARRLHLHVVTVRRYIRQGLLGHVNVGGRTHVSEEQLSAFIEARRKDAEL